MGVASRLPCGNPLPASDNMPGGSGSGNSAVQLEVTMGADLPLPKSLSEPRLESLVGFALGQEGAGGQWEISLLFTTDDRIQEMHREFMDLDSPTDIMTFPYEPDDFSLPEAGNRGGDIVISVETAALHAQDAGWNLSDELLFLILHGVLHILGWDDADPNKRATMLARQTTLLEAWRDYAGDATG